MTIRLLVVAGPAARRALGFLCAALGWGQTHRFPHPRLSLSHTDRRGVAAAAIDPAAAGIGVDLEHHRPADPRTARFFVRRHEETWLRTATERANEHLRLWTVKEALFKADLRNASTTLRDYALGDPSAATGLARAPSGARFVYTSAWRKDTVLSVAAAFPTRYLGAAMPHPTTVTFDAVAVRLGALLAVPPKNLGPQTFLADLAADSYEMVEIVIDLQEEFGVHFTQADLRPVLTLGDLVDLLAGKSHVVTD